jgi:hypothetical protein
MGPLEQRLFDTQLREILKSPELRTSVIQRLVAATIDAGEGERVVGLAIERVRAETRGPVTDLPRRILHALDAGCADYAAVRCLPYKKVVGPITRGWATWLSLAGQAGLTAEEGYAVIRDLLRTIPASHWSRFRDKDLEHELIEWLRVGFTVIGRRPRRFSMSPSVPVCAPDLPCAGPFESSASWDPWG